jgi:hypothetical protein
MQDDFDLGKELLGLEAQNLSNQIENSELKDIPGLLNKIAGIETETEQNVFIDKLAQKLQVDKRSIKNDIKKIRRPDKDRQGETKICAHFPSLIDLASNEKGEVNFLVSKGDSLEECSVWEHDGNLCAPPGKEHLPFALPRAAEVVKWYHSDDDKKLFLGVTNYLTRFSYLTDSQLLIITCNIFLTYLQDHPSIDYMPMLLFYAVPERGKSRTGKAACYISYRGIHCVDLREANLFRFSQDLKASLFIDIMDLWKKAERNGSEDILLLRYEKGAKATRVLYPEKGAFKDTVHFDIYGPTIIATNQAIHKILDSRCIPINMPNKPADYENPSPEKALELRERLTGWRARVKDMPLPEIAHIEELNGRLWDISRPLLQVCKLVYPEGFELLKNALYEVAGQRFEDKKDSIEGLIISALYELSPDFEEIPEWKIETQKVANILNENRPENHKLSPQYLGIKLKAMGIKTRRVHGYSEVILKRVDFLPLLEQYGILDSLPPVESLPVSTSLNNLLKSDTLSGREMVESCKESPNSLPDKKHKNQWVKSLVEIGSEFTGTREKKILKTVEVIE